MITLHLSEFDAQLVSDALNIAAADAAQARSDMLARTDMPKDMRERLARSIADRMESLNKLRARVDDAPEDDACETEDKA